MGKTPSKTELLAAIPLFAQCNKGQLKSIAAVADEIHLPGDRVLIEEGAHGAELIVVVTGEIEVTRNGQPVAALGAGSFVGETALLTKRPRNATVRTSTPVDLIVLSAPALRGVLADAPAIWEPLAMALAKRIAE